jgi:hypothetical protein
MAKKKTRLLLNAEDVNLKAEGWDEAIDLIVSQVREQIEALQKATRETTRVDVKDNLKYARELLRFFAESLKSAKGNKNRQVFDQKEVRAIFDHVTGAILPKNTALMAYFDDNFMPAYMEGRVELKQYSLKPPDEPAKEQV